MKTKSCIAIFVCLILTLCACSKKTVHESQEMEATPAFCQKWNPDFHYNKNRCCGFPPGIQRKKQKRLNFSRRKPGYCNEMTLDQIAYVKDVSNNIKNDPLSLILHNKERKEQAYCSVNDGFLAFGRSIVPSAKNHIKLRFPNRCTNFGTDSMIAILEWIGHLIDKTYPYKKYPNVHLLLGDIAAPRGGNLWGHTQRMTHRSHSNGQDADIGFFTVRKGKSPLVLHRQFDAEKNWWLIKHVFKNPFVCVKMAFLDKTLIPKLAKVAKKDPLWPEIRSHIFHVPGHHNHFHVRIGTTYGKPGCLTTKNIDMDDLDEDEIYDDKADNQI